MTVSIITPWLDHPELEVDYFAALAGAGLEHELLVVDNGSDPALSYAAIRFEENRGFCGANNAALELATGEVVVFVNNDVSLVRAGWLDELLAELSPGVLVGPKIRGDLHGQVGGRRYPYLDGWLLAGYTEEVRAFGWNEAYDAAGPAYYSDNEFSLRARVAGMTLREVRRVGLKHKVSQTAGPVSAETTAVARTNFAIFAETVSELVGERVDEPVEWRSPGVTWEVV